MRGLAARRPVRPDRPAVGEPVAEHADLTAALLYPGIGLLETTNVSVGRGTERPFEWVGAPWLDGRKLAAALNAAGLPGCASCR